MPHPTDPTPPASLAAPRTTLPVLGVPIDVLAPGEAVQRILAWAQQRQSRVVYLCNVHSVVTARQRPSFMSVLAGADMATPDGAPVAWMLRKLGARRQQRVSGPDLMIDFCDAASAAGEPIFLFGSTEQTLMQLRARLQQRYPKLSIAGTLSPPFRPLSPEEDEDIVRRLNSSGASSIWVSLGCPKQEEWMAAHRGRVNAVMVGVGAAFDFHAGSVARAPAWMRNNGLEWLHRLASDPQRLWRRYLVTNTLFLASAARQLIIGR